MARRVGPEIAKVCVAEMKQKAFDEAGAEALNAKIAAIWPALRKELEAFSVPVDVMVQALKDSGGPTTAQELGLDVDFYREAVIHAREIRKRYSALDIAADAGYLRDFAQNEG